MKNFTLLTLSALMMGSSVCMAQPLMPKHKKLDFSKSLKRNPVRPNDVKSVRASVKAAIKTAGDNAIWKPAHDTEYEYVDGGWEYSGEYSYKYDRRGNITEQVFDDGEGKYRLTKEYNEYNYVTRQLEDADEGEGYVNYELKNTVYDEQIHHLIVDKETLQWDEDANEWSKEMGTNCYRRTITRDEQGRVTKVVISTYYLGNYEDTQRQSISYDPQTGKAVECVMEQLVAADDGWGFVWENTGTFKNMVWDRTNGQLAEEYSAWFKGENRLKSADYYLTAGKEEFKLGTLNATYDEKGGYKLVVDMSESAQYGEPGSYQVDELTLTDDNGSYTFESRYYEDMDEDMKYTDEELLEHSMVVDQFDEHGNETLYKELMNEEEGPELVLMGSSKFDHKYEGPHGELTETVYSEWMMDYDDEGEEVEGSGHYEPMMKVVCDQFNDCTTGISKVTAGNEDAETVYNLQGVKVGTDARNLPAGIYIMKKGGKTLKTIKK